MKRYNTIWKRMLAAISAGCLCFSLAACGQPAAEPDGAVSPGEPGSSNGSNSPDSPTEPGSVESLAPDTGEVKEFPLTYTYEVGQRNLKSGKLACTINSAHLIDNTGGLPNTGGFISDASVTFRNQNGYWDLIYPEFIQEDGRLFPGLYLLMVELTVTSKDAASYTRKDLDPATGKPKGQYDDPYLFRADSLVYLLDLAPEAVEGQYGYYLLDYYSGRNQRAEHPMVFRLEPGESIEMTVGFLVGDSQQGGGMHLDSLYLSTTHGGYDPAKMLTRLDLTQEKVHQS